ncbi:Ribonuclease R [Buchnera aphidicola (Eriosoma grossulariae)]|uniref:ribonuclease R n=1 Tax=Buchnera aphidicola TaxID=9 RepID=UPI003464B87E
MKAVPFCQIKIDGKKKNIIPNSEFIYSWLHEHKKLISRKKLELIFNIDTKNNRIAFNNKLKTMEKNGKIVSMSNGLYTVPDLLKLVSGQVIGHRDGYGFLRTSTFQQDIWISIKNMKSCIHGDFVLASVFFIPKKNKKEVRIVKILKPNNNIIIGRCEFKKNRCFVIPNDNRLAFVILVNKIEKNIKHGSIVSVKLLRRPIQQTEALGKILELLGDSMNIQLAIKIAVRSYKISNYWNKNIIKELESFNISTSNINTKDRIDLRSVPFITIDSQDANDFDDAIFCNQINNSIWNIKIAIADVSYYVQPGTEIDKEAQKRGNSIYFPSCTIPMLPEKLSMNLCSLLPNLDRLAFICEVQLSHTGQILSYHHYEAVIRSHGKMTYSEVYKIWQGDKLLMQKYNYLLVELNRLKQLHQFLYASKEFNTGIAFKIIEPKILLDSNGKIKNIYCRYNNDVHKLIEFCMIIANSVASIFLKKFKEPTLFRDHDPPSINNIDKLKVILKELNLNWPDKSVPTALQYNQLLNIASQRLDYDVIQIILLRSMKPALYDSHNRGHFGLSLFSYTHFTSPIRRYSDLLLHRSIKYLLKKNKNDFSKKNSLIGSFHYTNIEMKKLGLICSKSERCSDEAVRDVLDWLKCDFMFNKINHSFYGFIISITNMYIFIRLKKFLIDVVLNIASLDNDKYIFDAKRCVLVGQKTGLKYHLGDVLKVCIKSVHILQSKIEVVLLR